MEKSLLKFLRMIITLTVTAYMLSACSSISLPSLTSNTPTTNKSHHPSKYHESLWEGSNNDIWEKLQHTSSSQLSTIQTQVNDPVKIAWIQLALISKRNSLNTPQLVRELLSWQQQH